MSKCNLKLFILLDIEKRNALIKYIPDNIQTIITTTDLKNINKNIGGK